MLEIPLMYPLQAENEKNSEKCLSIIGDHANKYAYDNLKKINIWLDAP